MMNPCPFDCGEEHTKLHWCKQGGTAPLVAGDKVRVKDSGELGTVLESSGAPTVPGVDRPAWLDTFVELHTRGPLGTRGNLRGWWDGRYTGELALVSHS